MKGRWAGNKSVRRVVMLGDGRRRGEVVVLSHAVVEKRSPWKRCGKMTYVYVSR
jgi:hypothetical protein